MNPLFCPVCDGAMVVTTGTVRFSRAVRPVVDQFVICLECPFTSQVQSGTGRLIDYGGLEIGDLTLPLIEPRVTVHNPSTDNRTKLAGRKDS